MTFQYQKNENGLYVCHVCKETREKQNTMHYHLKKHEGTMPHACPHCEKRFYQKYALDDHVKLRHVTKPATDSSVKCPFDGCTESFTKKEYCRLHIARNHVRPQVDALIEKKKDSTLLTCLTCKKECKSFPSILYHVMDHLKQTTDLLLRKKLELI